MKKRTKANTQRLNNLLILLILATVLLVMSTYAWFTANRTVNIDSIDVKVSTSSGLQISADGLDWKTVLTKDDLSSAYNTYAGAINQLPTSMAPVSTALEHDGNGLAMFYGNVSADMDATSSTYGEYVLKSEKTANGMSDDAATTNGISLSDKTKEHDSHLITTTGEYDKGYYIAFDIFVKSGNAAANFYMSGSAKEVELKSGKYEVVAEADEKGIANAARVALIKGANTGAGSTKDVIQALETKGTVYMWEPNADYHTAKGIENGLSLGWITAGSYTANAAGQTVIPYSGVKAAFTEPILLKNATATNHSDKFAAVNPTWTSGKKVEKPNLEMTGGIAAGITKYRVYMWVEGQDIDCENFASGTNLQYNITFSLDAYPNT